MQRSRARLPADQVFCFEDGPFHEQTAHDGNAPILVKRVIDSDHGSGYRWIDLVIVPPGADIGLHTHAPDSEEIYIFISGQGQMTLDGASVAVKAGYVARNRPGGAHSLLNTSNEDIRMIVLEVKALAFSPGRESS